jgi:hypothetical protein
MKSRLKEKDQAIALRKQGFSYKEIMEKIDVSKSSLSGWFKHIPFTEKELESLQALSAEKAFNGRVNATISNRERRRDREGKAFSVAKTMFSKFGADRNFILGVGLYWAEGGKRTSSFQFVNSDQEMLKFMIYWVKKYIGINSKDIFIRISTHEDFKLEKYEESWSLATGIPLEQFRKTSYKPNRHGIYKKNPNYKGCARLEIKGGMALLRTVISLQKILVQEIKVLY